MESILLPGLAKNAYHTISNNSIDTENVKKTLG